MKKVLLIAILILASSLRLFKLADFPSGLNADEAALGYNAYSLLLTGKDEHGHVVPINLESFADFKPAAYAYMLVPVVKVFGANPWTVRLPSALFGILAVGLIYVLGRDMFESEQIGLWAALVLAISPWHLHFSRGGWEVNVATTLLLLGVIFVRRWQVRPKLLSLVLGTVCFGLSMYTYQSTRLLAPVLGLGLVALGWRDFKGQIKQSLLAAAVLVVLLAPLAYSVISSDAGSRFAGVGLLADEGPKNRANDLRGQHLDPNSKIPKALHNRPLLYAIEFGKNYTDHFFGNFLFINGDTIERNRVPETGLLYFTDVVLVVVGALFVLRRQKSANTLWLWLLVAPLAAGLTFQTPHALRAQSMVIPLSLLVAVGLYDLMTKYRKLALIGLVLVYSWQFGRYLNEYYVHYPQTYPAAWEYGFDQVSRFVMAHQDEYQRIYITDKYDQPYILMLFFMRYPPTSFQGHHELSVRDRFNFSTVRQFDKYYFGNLSEAPPGSLIVAAPEQVAEGLEEVSTINFPNGKPAFKIVKN